MPCSVNHHPTLRCAATGAHADSRPPRDPRSVGSAGSRCQAGVMWREVIENMRVIAHIMGAARRMIAAIHRGSAQTRWNVPASRRM